MASENIRNTGEQFNRNDGHRRNNYKADDYYEEEGESYGDEEEYYSDEYSRSYDQVNNKQQSSPLRDPRNAQSNSRVRR